MVLPYGKYIKNKKIEEFDEAYVEYLYKYVGKQIIVPRKDYIIVLTKVRGMKRYHYGKLVGDQKKNLILDTIIYELEFTDGRA